MALEGESVVGGGSDVLSGVEESAIEVEYY